MSERIVLYQRERERTFKRWLDGEIDRDTARMAIRTITKWIDMLAGEKALGAGK